MKTIFITGEAGSGKTMLLRAIAQSFHRHGLDYGISKSLEAYQFAAKQLTDFWKLEELGKCFFATYTSDRKNRTGRESHDFDKTNCKRFILGQSVSYFNHETIWLFHTHIQNLNAELNRTNRPPIKPLHGECLELIKKATQHEASYSTCGLTEIKLIRENDYRYRYGKRDFCHFKELGDSVQDKITLLGDIATRLHLHYHHADFSEAKGLVLIDDICPNSTIASMMSFTKFLEETFPNVQFVVTTCKLMVGGNYPDEGTTNLVHSLGIEKTTFVLVQFDDNSAPHLCACDKYTSDFHF